MSELELMLVGSEISSAVSENFQFWMTTTFAVIVVTYNAGEKLAPLVRFVIATIYVMAAVMFFIRYRVSVGDAARIISLMSEINPGTANIDLRWVAYLRTAVMFAGSALAVIFIFKPDWASGAGKPRALPQNSAD